MSINTTAAHTPLHDPERDSSWVPPLHIVLSCARDDIAKHADANIHDHDAMIKAAVNHHIRLRELVAALDAEAPRG
ncbi:hypothetical protein [Streptomyces californicus]|uniref:hypothetical protein n=1 Tax=Streptomyces californicus TaxID=67351 RepID=UPI0004C02FF4|nr:hypothetical protein [Streptomyces californicus]QRV56654.1 hypothetical protein I6J40_22480 [Streptomyces californicus]